MRAPTPSSRVADAVAFVAFLVVPLLASEAFWDEFVTSKWYALEALAACWLLAEAWAGSGGAPRFLRDNAWLAVPAAALALQSVLRSGAAAALAPFAERSAVLALALCAYWWLRRGGGSLEAARSATALALAIVTAIGFAQAVGRDPLAGLMASDGRGSTFGNANMAAQYAAAAVLLLATAPRPRARWRIAMETLVAVAAAVWLVVLGTRSVLVALGAAIAVLGVLSRKQGRVRLAAAIAVSAALVGLASWGAGRLLAPDQAWRKAASVEHRLHVWADTLRLVKDNPLGVGAGNFEDAYRPYQATGAGFTDERQVYRHPHNEYLRAAAEDGLPLLVLLGILLARLAKGVARTWRAGAPPERALLAAWTAYLLAEGFFQFPLALAFPALATAVLLGLALWHAEGAPPPPPAAPWRAGAVAAAVLILLAAGRVALSERLFVAEHGDLQAQERACRLDPRNLPACVMASWLRGASGDMHGARERLAAVLQRAPHYPPAIKLLAQQALVAGDREAACVYMAAYEALFRGQSSLHGDYLGSCDEGARQAAWQKVPSPHYTRFPLAGEDAWRRAPGEEY